MVDVGVREDHRVDFRGIKGGEVQIREVGLFAPALKSATFQQKFFCHRIQSASLIRLPYGLHQKRLIS